MHAAPRAHEHLSAFPTCTLCGRQADERLESGEGGDPPPVDRPARPLVAFEVEVREAPSETDRVARRAHAFERAAEAPPLDDLVDREAPAVGPAYDERVDAPLVGDAGVEAYVELSTPRGFGVGNEICHGDHYRTEVLIWQARRGIGRTMPRKRAAVR